MITTKYVRDNIDAIKRSLEKRKSDYPIDELLELDKDWRAMQAELQELQHKRNVSSEEISKVKKEGRGASKMISSVSDIKERINILEVKIAGDETRIEYLLWNLPIKMFEPCMGHFMDWSCSTFTYTTPKRE